MTHPRVLVCGLGRYGTSLAMQMLAATGVPCVGTGPDFEPPAVDFGADLSALPAGHAAKILDPQRRNLTAIPRPSFALILDREPTAQARSQIAFLVATYPERRDVRMADNRQGRARWAARLICDRSRAVAALKAAAIPVQIVRFEQLVLPTQGPDILAAALAPWWWLDKAAMAAVIRPAPAEEGDAYAAAAGLLPHPATRGDRP